MAKKTTSVVPNQVFVGCPWKTIRAKYEKVIDKLKVRSPLSFVIVGRGDKQDAEDLLEIIKHKLSSSSYAIFDATNGNPNVSLEYGYAEASEIPRVLYMGTHGASKPKEVSDSPIIADLAGKKRNHYKVESALISLLEDFSKKHAFTVRFERFLSVKYRSKIKGTKKRVRALSLKVIHALDGQETIRRGDLVSTLLADQSNYSAEEINQVIRALHQAGLLTSGQGPFANISMRRQ